MADANPGTNLAPGLLAGRCGVVLGVANNRSIAWGIARTLAAAGAQVLLAYQNERLARSVGKLADELGDGAATFGPCDVQKPEDVAALADHAAGCWGRVDFVVHGVAFAEREALGGRFVDVAPEHFSQALAVSSYSLVAVARAFEAHLRQGQGAPSLLTLSYLGSERAVPGYHIMGVAKAALEASVRYLAQDLGPHGIRVNALSPGPMRTLSAAAIPGMRAMLRHTEAHAPLRRGVTLDDVGGMALTLLSDLGAGVSGEVLHVDAGYHVLAGMGAGLAESGVG